MVLRNKVISRSKIRKAIHAASLRFVVYRGQKYLNKDDVMRLIEISGVNQPAHFP